MCLRLARGPGCRSELGIPWKPPEGDRSSLKTSCTFKYTFWNENKQWAHTHLDLCHLVAAIEGWGAFEPADLVRSMSSYFVPGWYKKKKKSVTLWIWNLSQLKLLLKTLQSVSKSATFFCNISRSAFFVELLISNSDSQLLQTCAKTFWPLLCVYNSLPHCHRSFGDLVAHMLNTFVWRFVITSSGKYKTNSCSC